MIGPCARLFVAAKESKPAKVTPGSASAGESARPANGDPQNPFAAPLPAPRALFFQRESDGLSTTILMSLLMTCKAAGVNPREYFRDVLVRIAAESDVEKLVPHEWKKRFEPEIRERRERVLDQIRARPGA